VRYRLEYSDDAAAYLRSYEGLSRTGRTRLAEAIDQNIRQLPDAIRDDPSRRFPNAPSLFFIELVIYDPAASTPLHAFRFVVDDQPAVYGVLRIVFVDSGGPGPAITS
jgi:hypothetical protein